MIQNITLIPGRISVGFSTDNYETTENSGNVTVCVDVLVPSEFGALRPFTVALLPIQGTIYT